MPNINLIAQQRAEQKQTAQLARTLTVGLIASVGVVFVLASYLVARQVSLGGEYRTVEDQLKKLEPTLKEIEELEKRRDEMKPKVQTLKDARLETLRWCALLQTVADAVPPGTWLQSLNSAPGATPEEPATIKLQGTASSHALVSQLQIQLAAKDPILTEVNLNKVADMPSIDGNHVGKIFDMEARLASVAIPEKKDKENKEKKDNGSA